MFWFTQSLRILKSSALLGLILLFAGCATPPVPVESPPNVLLIITDDQGYGDIAAHGNPVLKTPALDRLHAESVRFTNFHVSPTCAPTRAALMTGRVSNATGAWHTIMGRSLIHPDEVTIADGFRGAGYRTGIFGKWHLGDNYPSRPQDNGFDEVLIHGGGGVHQTPDYFGNDYFDDTYFRNGEPEKQEGFCTDVWFENAIRFMEETSARQQPFFCYLTTNAPHSPMWAPDEDAAAYEGVEGLSQPGFYGMIANIDDNMAKVLEFLNSSGLDDNTILIFMTDNGTAAGDQVFNAGMRERKGSAYDGGHRVPFFMRWPGGGIEGPKEIDTLAAHIDVLPTLMDLCGIAWSPGPSVHGTSLKPLLSEEDPSWPERVLVTDSQRMENLKPWRRTAVMTQRWRLVNPSIDGEPEAIELYDIQADPGQEKNVASVHPDVVERLKDEYDKWWLSASEREDQLVRIGVGGPDNPARLTAHDWHGPAAEAGWNQAQIREAPAVNGWSALDVLHAGTYRIELRRWPKEVDLPINAPYQDSAPNREKTPGKAIDAINAHLRIGDISQSTAVSQSDKAAVFQVGLPLGPARLEAWFECAGGVERGAFYVYVERLPEPE